MNPFFYKIAGYVVRRIASDPVARSHVVGATKRAAKEAQEIASSEDPAHAAGQAVRRTLDKLKRRDG